MTVITDVPATVAGISAAELEIMQAAADVFRQQHCTEGRHGDDPFGALAEPFTLPPATTRIHYDLSHAGHYCD